ncbi:MAG: hypothetical protein JNK63_09555 [Chthonomonas sp.]|nr:hypothetical protein [Chthonomonas sp.]
MSGSSSEVRYAEIAHETAHARVQVVLDLDGGTRRDLTTGIGTLDHLLTQWAFFAGFDLGISCEGNLHLDDQQTVEAIGTALGAALCLALTDTGPIERLGSAHGVTEDACVMVATDLIGNGALGYQVSIKRERLGLLAAESIEVFLLAFARAAKISLHVQQIAGENGHHIAEAIFKGLGQAMAKATHRNEHHRLSRRGKEN